MKKITMSVVVAVFVFLTLGQTGCMSQRKTGARWRGTVLMQVT